MKKITLIIALLTISWGSAQHTITGTFSPAEDYTWLIAYRLKSGTQNYVANTQIQNGTFVLNIPSESSPGVYRLVYAVPQEEFYFDVIYNGNEDIALVFDAETGVSFISSKENKLFNGYFRDINAREQLLIDFFANGKTDPSEFLELVKQIKDVQVSYTERSEGLIAHEFIAANAPYIPSGYEAVQDYIKNKKANYFNTLDFSKPALRTSSFLTDKVINYIFTALPLEQMDQLETEEVMQENVKTVHAELLGMDDTYKEHIFYSLWTQLAAASFNVTSDFVYNNYLKALAQTTNNLVSIEKIETHNRLRTGAVAPEIEWKEGDTLKKLSDLHGATTYVLIFWSSTCSHCLDELPKLHSRLKENSNSNSKVLAVGLEDDDINWKLQSAKLPDFEHAITLGKWESELASLYAIQQTPSYFVLDTDKKIVAKPDNYTAVLEFLKGLQ